MCRCPECGRSFCRECVTEHQSRLLCAGCLTRIAGQAPPQSGMRRHAMPAVLLAAGLVLSWLLFFGAGEAILAMVGRG
ncbi:MAG TPA: hypothetical protein VG456_16035 [Candidatus Sulfopaludibacter sp.]|nr:hypothetical protein [Candidatus Sulfopaludibacter sp.]